MAGRSVIPFSDALGRKAEELGPDGYIANGDSCAHHNVNESRPHYSSNQVDLLSTNPEQAKSVELHGRP
jgi:hypothetical protein